MATTPVFASAGRVGQIQLNNASGTTVSATILAGVAAGTRVREIRVFSGPTTAPGTGVLAIILDDGTNQNVIDVVTLTNTANLQQAIFSYSNLILPNSSHTIKAVMRTAITSGGTIHISVLGEDLT